MADAPRLTCSFCGDELDVAAPPESGVCQACRAVGGAGSRWIADTDIAAATQLLRCEDLRGAVGDDPEASNRTSEFTPSGGTITGPKQTAAPQETIGRFRVYSAVGRGSFGTVYRAFDPVLDREVAIKVPRFENSDGAITERFLREAKAAAGLRHPNIVMVYESGLTAKGPYIVVEFVDGVPLSTVIREGRPPLRSAVDWMRQIAEALHYSHTEGIVHRDVKPSNIMMNRSGRPQLMDFGLAKRDSDDNAMFMTLEGSVFGTPAYMAPEQARGDLERIGPRSDQYSVGVVLYELLCGRTPYSGDVLYILSCVTNMQLAPPAPRAMRKEIPRDLEACCLKAMAKEPEARYASLQAFADDLDNWLKGLPLQARPIGPAEQLQRWCRANKLIAGLALTMAAMVVAATILGYGLAYRFQELANLAGQGERKATAAGERERRSRLAAEQLLIDNYTETGLAADRDGDPHEAILWFANAVAAAENHPLRERHNRIRLQSWLPTIARPVAAFAAAGTWNQALRFHASGKFLLSESNSGKCELRDLATGRTVPLPWDAPLHRSALSSDGRRLALASSREVALFDFDSRQEVDRWSHPDEVRCLEFSPDGRRIAVGGERDVGVRDLGGDRPSTVFLPIGSRVVSATFSRQGDWIAVRAADRQVHVFPSGATGESKDAAVATIIPPQPTEVEDKLAPLFLEHDRLVILDNRRGARCWDLAEKRVLWELGPGRCLSAAVAADGRQLAIGEDFHVRVLEAASGREVAKLVHRNLVYDLRFHPAGTLLLTACGDYQARVFHVPSGRPASAPIPHSDIVHRCDWAPDGKSFATVHWSDQLVRVWQLEEGLTDSFTTSSQSSFVRLDPSGERWLPSGFDTRRVAREYFVRDVQTGRVVGPKLEMPGLISDADFVAGGSRVVLVGQREFEEHTAEPAPREFTAPGIVRLLDASSGTRVVDDIETPSQPIAVRESPGGDSIVVLCHAGQVLLIDARSGKLRTTAAGLQGNVASYGYVIRDRIRFSPRGDRFAIWGSESRVEVRDVAEGKLRFAAQHEPGFVHDVQFSPDGTVVASCSSDKTVRLWNAADGREAGSPLRHSGWVFAAQFSRDGKRLLTASSDHQARIWDLATGRAVLATREQADEVFGVAFLPHEDVFLISTRDGRVSAWDATIGKILAPVRRYPEMVYQLALSDVHSQVVAAGRSNEVQSFPWRKWLRAPDTELDRDDVRILGEILAQQRVQEGGAATPLTTSEWLERWNRFRDKHPQHPALQATE